MLWARSDWGRGQYCDTVRITADLLCISARTPLYFAALYGRQSVVEKLIKSGAEVNSKNKEGQYWFKHSVEQIKDVYCIQWMHIYQPVYLHQGRYIRPQAIYVFLFILNTLQIIQSVFHLDPVLDKFNPLCE